MTLTLRLRIYVAAIFTVLTVALYFYVATRAQAGIAGYSQNILAAHLASMKAAEDVKHAFVQHDDCLFRYLATGSAAQLEESRRYRERAILEMNRQDMFARGRVTEELLRDLKKESQRYFDDARRLVESAKQDTLPDEAGLFRAAAWAKEQANKKQSLSLISVEGQNRLVRIYSLCEKLVDINRVRLEEAQREIEGMMKASARTARALAIGAGVLTLLIATWLSLSVGRPVNNLLAGVHRVMKGDLGFQIPVLGSDEIGRLTQAFNAMTHQLQTTHERLLNETITDALTGVYNLRYFQKMLAQEVERARRYGTPVSLLLLDIDHFKRFNDTHGHEMGNIILKKVAEILKDNLRDVDMLARYGGEEFAIIAPNTDAEDAFRHAKRLCDVVAHSQLPGRESQPGGVLSLSLGGAAFPQDAATDKDLILKADKALYASKKQGRRRATWWSEDIP